MAVNWSEGCTTEYLIMPCADPDGDTQTLYKTSSSVGALPWFGVASSFPAAIQR